MRAKSFRCSGRADPFGLLVLAVTLALLITIGIQVMLTRHTERVQVDSGGCAAPCATADARY